MYVCLFKLDSIIFFLLHFLKNKMAVLETHYLLHCFYILVPKHLSSTSYADVFIRKEFTFKKEKQLLITAWMYTSHDSIQETPYYVAKTQLLSPFIWRHSQLIIVKFSILYFRSNKLCNGQMFNLHFLKE